MAIEIILRNTNNIGRISTHSLRLNNLSYQGSQLNSTNARHINSHKLYDHPLNVETKLAYLFKNYSRPEEGL